MTFVESEYFKMHVRMDEMNFTYVRSSSDKASAERIKEKYKTYKNCRVRVLTGKLNGGKVYRIYVWPSAYSNINYWDI